MDSHPLATLPLRSSQPPSQSRFTLFTQLPIELRFQIWYTAFPRSRVVKLIYDAPQDRYFSFNSTLPILLHICHETRSKALESFHLCFGTKSHPPRIYFDFARDILLFDDSLANMSLTSEATVKAEPVSLGPMTKVELDGIQHVAISTDCFRFREPRNQSSVLKSVCEPLLRFASLRSLTFVVEEVNPYCRGEIMFSDIMEHKGDHPPDWHCIDCEQKQRCPEVFKECRNRKDAFIESLREVRIVTASRKDPDFDIFTFEFDMELESLNLPIGSLLGKGPDGWQVILPAEEGLCEEWFSEEEDMKDEEEDLTEEIQDLIADEKRYLQFCKETAPRKTPYDLRMWPRFEFLSWTPIPQHETRG